MNEMNVVAEFFFVDILGIWLGLSLLSVLIMVLVETFHERFATIAMIGVVAYLRYVHYFDVIGFAAANPWGFVFWLLGYVGAGTGSTYLAWMGFIADHFEAEEEEAKKWKREPNWTPLEAFDHKEQLTSWVFLWPWKMFWFLLRHPARRIKNAIFRAVEHQLDAISIKMTERAKARFERRRK